MNADYPVTGFDWANPHVQIFLEAIEGEGKVEKLTAGGPSPSRMAAPPGTRTRSKPAIQLPPSVSAQRTLNLLRIQKVVRSSGRGLVGYGG